jgi:hypothetical protein
MSKKIKLNQEDVKALTDLNSQKKILRDKLVTIGLLELEVEDKKDEIKEFRKNINAIQSGLGQKLTQIYGDGTIDYDTMEFIPKKSS